MGFFKRLFKPFKKIADKVFDFVTDTVKAAVDIVASPFKMPDMGMGDGTGTSVNENILGPLLNKDSGVGPIPVIYGERRVGGHRVFISTNGSTNQYLYVALALCEGQIDSIDKIFIDDIEVPMSSYAHGTQATPSSGDFQDRLKTQFFDGRDDQVASTLLSEAPNWGSNHRLRGVAYLACRFEWKKIESQEDADNNPYKGGVPNINVRLKGRKIFDVTSGYTQTFDGSITSSNNAGPLGTASTVAHLSNFASGTNTTRIPTGTGESYTGNVFITTTEPNAVVKVKMQNTASVRDNTTGDRVRVFTGFAVFDSSNGNELFNTNTDGRPFNAVETQNSTPATSIIDENYIIATAGSYQIQLTSTVGPFPEAQGPTPVGSVAWSVELPTTSTLTHSTAYADETEVYSTNPVNVLVDYLRNPRYGKGLSNDYFAWTSIQEAAQQCNQTVPYTSSTNGKFSEFDGVLDTGTSLLNNVKSILASFNGIMPYQAGQYFVKIHHGGNLADIDAAPNPPPVTMIINEDHIVGGLKIQGESKQRKINQLRVTYTDPDADYQPNDVFWPPSDSSVYSGYLTEDNSIPLHKQVALPHCTHRERALNMAETLVKTSRNKMALQFATTTACSDVSVGDLVRIQNKNLNFNGVFRVESISLAGNGSLGFTATEHNSNDYVLDGQAAAAAKPTISLPNPLTVTAPTGVTVTSGSSNNNTSGYVASSRLKVTYTASTDPFVTEYIVQFKLASDSTYTTAGITNDLTFFIDPVSVGDQIDVRVAARNELDRRSNFANAATHTVT